MLQISSKNSLFEMLLWIHFFFKLLIICFTFYFIFVYFRNFRGSKNRGSMDPVHERGPWTRSIFWWTRSMDPVHGGGPWTRGPCFVLSRKNHLLINAFSTLIACPVWRNPQNLLLIYSSVNRSRIPCLPFDNERTTDRQRKLGNCYISWTMSRDRFAITKSH